MKAEEVMGTLMVYSTIYDVDLPQKILREMEEEQLHLDPEKMYDIDILFGTKVFELDDFYSFNVTNPMPRPGRRKMLPEAERKRRKMYDILSEQQENVVNTLNAAGINIWESSIIGEEYISTFFVDVVFYLHEPKPKENGHCNVVMPSREAFYKNLEKIAKEIEEDQARRLKEAEEQRLKEAEEQKQREQHEPNWFLAEELFSEIAQSMYPSDVEKATAHKEMLYNTANLVSDWPLQLKSKGKVEKGASIGKDSKLDCPEYMIYIQNTNGEWSIEETENLNTAKKTIMKKRKDRIIVLHNLKTVPYTLFRETDEGLVSVTADEAQGKEKLFLYWNK